MTDPVVSTLPPRPRTLAHPGPFDPIRIQHLNTARGRHFHLALEPGRTLHDAIVEPLHALGVASASMTILGGPIARLLFCVAPPDPSGQRVANYTRPVDVGAAFLIFGNATLGRDARGGPLVHCHAAFASDAGEVRGGHIVVDRSVVGARPLSVLVTALDGIELRLSIDAETAMPLLRPFSTAPEAAHV